MKSAPDQEVKTEYKLVSDMDIRPNACINCAFTVLIRRSYKFIDLQDIGSPSIKRILRHEMVLWECKKCGKQFTTMKRVASDLALLHHAGQHSRGSMLQVAIGTREASGCSVHHPHLFPGEVEGHEGLEKAMLRRLIVIRKRHCTSCSGVTSMACTSFPLKSILHSAVAMERSTFGIMWGWNRKRYSMGIPMRCM